jgi:hypothetical protein
MNKGSMRGGGLLSDPGRARHRDGVARGFCAANCAQAHDFNPHVGFTGGSPVAMQHRRARPSFQVTILKYRDNPRDATVFPSGMRSDWVFSLDRLCVAP